MIPHHRGRSARALLLIFIAACSVVAVWPRLSAEARAPFSGRVVGVSDGDTITVLADGRGQKIRLWGIDCPEKKQDFGQRAKQFTSSMVFGKDVRVEVMDQDRYRRWVAKIYLSDGRMLNQELVKAGFAWWYRAYARNARDLAALEKTARAEKRGLWSAPNPTPPWDYRREQLLARRHHPSERYAQRRRSSKVTF